MKRIQRGPVRGISLKLQEEERERRMDSIPNRSVLDVDTVTIDRETKALLESLNISDIPIQVQSDRQRQTRRTARKDKKHE